MAFTTLLLGALREGRQARLSRDKSRFEINIGDMGDALVRVYVGDIDGSGESLGVQLDFEHEFGKGAVAFGAGEAEIVGKALLAAAATIPPSARLRTKAQRWDRARP
jgi:hypothetical protein